jgi:hypothetical protein
MLLLCLRISGKFLHSHSHTHILSLAFLLKCHKVCLIGRKLQFMHLLYISSKNICNKMKITITRPLHSQMFSDFKGRSFDFYSSCAQTHKHTRYTHKKEQQNNNVIIYGRHSCWNFIALFKQQSTTWNRMSWNMFIMFSRSRWEI